MESRKETKKKKWIMQARSRFTDTENKFHWLSVVARWCRCWGTRGRKRGRQWVTQTIGRETGYKDVLHSTRNIANIFCNNCEWSSTFKNRLKKLSEQRKMALHCPPDNKYAYVISRLFEATGRLWMRNVPPLAGSSVAGTGPVVSGPGHALLPYRCKPGRDN